MSRRPPLTDDVRARVADEAVRRVRATLRRAHRERDTADRTDPRGEREHRNARAK